LVCVIRDKISLFVFSALLFLVVLIDVSTWLAAMFLAL
jgi:hypothetical protein